MTLQELLGEELYAQVEEKIQEKNKGVEDKLKHVRFVDLSEGGYISKDKYMTLKTQADGLDKQLKEANTEIQSYKGMDIDGIKKKAEEWETKYNTDTTALQEKISQQAYDFEMEKYAGKYKFSSDLAKKAAISELREKKFPLENGAFLGADDFMKQMKESNPAAFVDEDPAGSAGGHPQVIIRPTSGGYKPQTVTDEKAVLDQKYANNPYYRK